MRDEFIIGYLYLLFVNVNIYCNNTKIGWRLAYSFVHFPLWKISYCAFVVKYFRTNLYFIICHMTIWHSLDRINYPQLHTRSVLLTFLARKSILCINWEKAPVKPGIRIAAHNLHSLRTISHEFASTTKNDAAEKLLFDDGTKKFNPNPWKKAAEGE